MVAHALEPAGDGGVGVASVADHAGDVDAFGHQPEDHLDAVGCCLEIVEWGVAAAGEVCSAPLAAEVLDVSLDAAFAVAHEGMNLVISDAEEVAKRIEACETGGEDLFLAPSRAFALGVGLHLTLDRAGL